MKTSVVFANLDLGTDFGAIRDAVQALEGAGFDGFGTNDHVIGGHPDRAEGQAVHTSATGVHEPLVLLSFVGAVTTRMELFTFVLLLPQRQTTLVAKQVAELDLLSGGRVRLGVGIGRNWMEYEALNEDFTTRGRRLEEQIEVLRRYWTEEHVTFEGRWHHLDRVGLNPMPIQRPVPIWMGSFAGNLNEKVLERIGRLADGWMPLYPPDDDFAAAVQRLHGYARDAGRDPASIAVECGVRVAPGDSPDDWIAAARRFRDIGATQLRVAGAPGFGGIAQTVEGLIRWRDTVVAALG